MMERISNNGYLNEKSCGRNEKSTKLSYWKGDTSYPLKELTIGQLVDVTALQFTDRTAICLHRGEQLTYKQVKDKTDTLAAAFVALGLEKGDHIAIWGFNSIEWYLSFLAANKAGLVAVNINPLFEGTELLNCLLLSDSKAIVMKEIVGNRSLYSILSDIVPEIVDFDNNSAIETKKIPYLTKVICVSQQPCRYRGTFSWDYLFKLPRDAHRQQIAKLQSRIDPFNVCNIQFTSGTTSKPKGVLLTHYNLVNNGFLVGKHLQLDKKINRPCVPIPFFHAYGLSAGLLASICYGATLMIPFEKYNAAKVVSCIRDEKCTLMYGTPTMYIDFISVLRDRIENEPNVDHLAELSSLERVFTGGAMCLPQTFVDLNEMFPNVKITSGYGMTELSPVTMMSLPDEPQETIFKSVGRVMDHTEVKVINEEGETVPLGTCGEICFRGYMLMKGYYKNETKTNEVIHKNGWFSTGDRFILLENGYTQIVGRIKDTIIRGGENIEPKEVEDVIMRHCQIIDVQVYGVFDERLGETVAASILKKEGSNLTENDIKKFCEGKIAVFKIPKYVIFCTEYPRTASAWYGGRRTKSLRVRNIPSLAATSSLALAEYIAKSTHVKFEY